MSEITHDVRTMGYVLRRTNYGEADRILNIITPNGKVSAIAKGVRKEKSKLAGSIEMLTRIDFNINRGKGELGVITGAKMIKYFGNIIKDYSRTELATSILKKINQLSDSSDNPEYYDIVDQSMEALNDDTNLNLIKTWINFNIKKSSGEEINLYRDIEGNKLEPTKKYEWDYYEKSLKEKENGLITANEIKAMRLILTNKLKTVAKIKNIDEHILPIFLISEAI